MPRSRRKSDLPVKTCATCGRPMVWRRKWSKVWDQVRHCSERCRRARGCRADGVDGATGACRDADGR